jgi:hypothetical protein
MAEIPRYIPRDSAHNTTQPWGQHEVVPYTPAEEQDWIDAVKSRSAYHGDSDGNLYVGGLDETEELE